MPKPKIVWEVDDKNKSIQNIVTEWEKNKIKIVFRKLDTGNIYNARQKTNTDKSLDALIIWTTLLGPSANR